MVARARPNLGPEPGYRGSGFGQSRQSELEDGAAGRICARRQVSFVPLDDRTAYRQAKTEAGWLGRVEGLEQVFLNRWCEPGTGAPLDEAKRNLLGLPA